MKKMDLFSGLCVLESEELALDVAATLKEQLSRFEDSINLYFKGSFDKANRTSINSFRGPGLKRGLEILDKVKSTSELPVLTDFHYPDQAFSVAEVVDVLQVPAFLCRQTDMIVEGAKACARFGRQLKIKKGQFISPHDTKNIVEKASEYLPKDKIILTERGTFFGYNALIVDMASFEIMKSFGVRAIHDATHSVQMPGGMGNQTGGKREQIPSLARAAVAAGASGIFLETHPEPDQAKSDKSTCLPLDSVSGLIEELLRIYKVVNCETTNV